MNRYFDNAAACRPHPFAAEHLSRLLLEEYANQESSGAAGEAAARKVAAAGERIAGILLPGGKTFFFHTGTDALNAVVQAHFRMHPGTKCVTTEAEHPALLKALERHAPERILLPLKKDGTLDPEELFRKAPDGISLAALHHVNSETGHVTQEKMLADLKAHFPKMKLLLDTTQSAGKLPVPECADFITFSGCKIGAPCGGGAVVRGDRGMQGAMTALRNRDHQTGRVVPAVCEVLAEVLEYDVCTMPERTGKMQTLKEILRERLSDTGCTETSPDSSPYILHLLFPGKQGQILVRMLNAEGFSVSAGSACASETAEPSPVLRAMGYGKREAFGAFRISFWEDLAPADAESLASALKKALKNY